MTLRQTKLLQLRCIDDQLSGYFRIQIRLSPGRSRQSSFYCTVHMWDKNRRALRVVLRRKLNLASTKLESQKKILRTYRIAGKFDRELNLAV